MHGRIDVQSSSETLPDSTESWFIKQNPKRRSTMSNRVEKKRKAENKGEDLCPQCMG